MTVQPPESSVSAEIDLDAPAEEHPLTEAGRQATESASDAAQRATNIGMQRADQGLERAATGLNDLAGNIRRVSTEMETDQPTIANVASAAADQTERLARYLRETDARGLIATIEDLARRQPILFLGGAFLLGVAASRLLKAGVPSSRMRSLAAPRYATGTYGYVEPSIAYRPTGPGTANVPSVARAESRD
jgi:hypothetical protein